jgi:hypothetical protein
MVDTALWLHPGPEGLSGAGTSIEWIQDRADVCRPGQHMQLGEDGQWETTNLKGELMAVPRGYPYAFSYFS